MLMGSDDPDSNSEPDFSELCLVHGDLTDFNFRRVGEEVHRIDISFNSISRLRGLNSSSFTSLEELILDNNQLDHLDIPVPLTKLRILSLNKNRIRDLPGLLSLLAQRTPLLEHLSLLGNPCCPDQLSDDFVDESDYQIYRYYILHHLPSLRFLDHKAVGKEELLEARKSLYSSPNLTFLSRPLAASVGGAGYGKSRQGKRRTKYVGKNSEGNRFIRDNDL